MKQKFINDIQKFLSPSTKDFYYRNGIPYRRSYLFYGLPGTGKTSFIQAIAGKFNRSICFMMPTHPAMTDESLRQAINEIPDNTIVVFEDIDTLFSKDRKNKVDTSALTFTGLLNALDGIGNSNGQIYVLTTNLREDLDHALIRNGRVDIHFEFTYAIPEQMEQMWSNFYPSTDETEDSAAMAKEFSNALIALLEANNMSITTSTLQHYFVTQMDSTPNEALDNIHCIIDDMKAHTPSPDKEATSSRKRNNKKSGLSESLLPPNKPIPKPQRYKTGQISLLSESI